MGPARRRAHRPRRKHHPLRLAYYLDVTLPMGDRERFEVHLSVCAGCTEYMKQMRQTVAATGHLNEEALEPRMRDQLMELFRDWTRSR